MTNWYGEYDTIARDNKMMLIRVNQVYRTRAKAVSSKPIFNAGTERFVRDWRSAHVTVTVRDQRHREHDPILGVVALSLPELMKTSSQVTRWYPLDGGIGFGRMRVSLLWRSVETKLPPNMLGWDVGTFEFISDRITLKNYSQAAKIKLRTGGSTGKLPRSACKSDENGYYFDITDKSATPRLPVKYRYRSPVVFEFHVASKRGAVAYAVLWLQHLVDNEQTQIDIPIWTTKSPNRLIQNYVTEENWQKLNLDCLKDLTEVGRIQFTGRFSPGMDESHERFVSDNDSRETFETWEACRAEGVRGRHVSVVTPDNVKELHEKSLVQGRDILRDVDPKERKRWITQDGVDWSGTFGEDPQDYIDEQSHETEKFYKKGGTTTHGNNANSNHKMENDNNDDDEEDYDTSDDDSDDGDKSTSPSSSNGTSSATSNDASQPMSDKAGNKANKRSERRQQRGLMQWKPARNAIFAKHEATFALRKMKKKFGMGDLTGREPDVETETGS